MTVPILQLRKATSVTWLESGGAGSQTQAAWPLKPGHLLRQLAGAAYGKGREAGLGRVSIRTLWGSRAETEVQAGDEHQSRACGFGLARWRVDTEAREIRCVERVLEGRVETRVAFVVTGRHSLLGL